MRLRNKYYPYPVVVEGGDYYDGSSFSSSVVQSMDGYNIKLSISAELNDDLLCQMIDKNEVCYAHHIECSQTCYRRIFKTQEAKLDLLLNDTDIDGEVQVCSFIMANKDIADYKNESFSADYHDIPFDIEKGCILAVGNQFNIMVNKIRDDLANTSSIFTISPNKEPDETNILVDYSQQKIIVKLPEETFHQYCNIQELIDIQPVMHSMIIVPALTYVLSVLQLSESLDEWENHRWYRSLRKACRNMGINIEGEQLREMDIFNTAQQLLNSPIVKAIDFSAKGGGTYED